MKKLITLLLCLVMGTGYAGASMHYQSGVLQTGTWKIENGVLTVDAVIVDCGVNSYAPRLSGRVNPVGGRENVYENMMLWWDSSPKIKEVRLSSRVMLIGKYAFAGMTNLERVVIEDGPDKITIGAGAFCDCWRLKSFDFSRVEAIGEEAFDCCYSLEEVYLPNIKTIRENAFRDCVSLWKEEGGIYLPGNEVVKGLDKIEENKTCYASFSLLNDNAEFVKIWSLSGTLKIIVNPEMYDSYITYYGEDNPRIGFQICPGELYKWYLEKRNSGGYLIIRSGFRGEIPDYADETQQPWYPVRDMIRFVDMKYADRWGTRIGKNAFKGCSKLEGFGISVKSYDLDIGESAFENTRLADFLPMEKVVTVGKKAFANTQMGEANLSSATTVGDYAFDGSPTSLVTFGPINSIGQYAFRNCFKKSGKIHVNGTPPATTSSNAFQGANLESTWLFVNAQYIGAYQSKAPWSSFNIQKEVEFPAGGDYGIGYGKWELTEDGTLTISTSLNLYDTKIPDYASVSNQPWFQYHEYIRKIVLTNDIKQVGQNAFAFEQKGQSRIISIEAPSVTAIGDNAFQNNEWLTSFTGEKVQTIGNYAFAGCAAIQDYKFGSDLKTIGKNAFDGCANVDVMSLTAATPPEVSAETFQGIGSSSGSQGTRLRAATGQSGIRLDVPEQYITKYLGNLYWRMFSYYVGEHGNVVKTGKYYDGLWVIYSDGTLIASSDTSEGDIEGFYNDATVKRVELLGNATQLNWTGFNKLPNVEEIVLSSSMVTLGDEVFMGLSKLKRINLDRVRTIGRRVFKDCSKLQVATMSATEQIGINAFENCTSLDSVKVTGNTKLDYYLFKGCTSLRTADLSGMSIYSNTTGLFTGCTKLESVTLKAFALSVSTNMFKDCKNLKTVTVGNDCRIIYSNAFAGTGLQSIYCYTPKPPKLYADAFGDLALSSITAYVPADYLRLYKKADVWKQMNIVADPAFTESMFPLSGPVGEIGIWKLDDKGTLSISGEGKMPDNYNGMDTPWYEKFDEWMPWIKNVIYTDGITAIAENVTNKEAEAGFYDGVKTVEIGADVKYIRGNAMRYSGLTDVYCFAIEPPSMVYSQSEDMTFDFPALKTNNCTLHVPDFYGTLDKYKSNYMWKDFPRIVADLPTRKPGTVYVESLALKPDAKHLAILPDELGSYTYQIEPVIYPACADNKVLTWTSDDESVATVDENGLVTILAYPIDYNIVTISAVTTDGSNKRATCELFIYNPEEVQGGIPATDLAINRTSITLLKSSKSTVKVSLTPANSNSYVSTMIEGQGTIDVFEMFDPMTGVTQRNVFEITPRDLGTFVITFQATDVDWEQVSEYPTAVLTVNVIDDVIFTEKSAEGVPVTYIVNSLDENTCSLYGKREQEIWVDPETGIPTWGEETYYTAVDTETKGDVTIPTKAGGYFVVGVSNLAFRNCNNLTAVGFDEGIQFIGNQAFEGCESLREVYLPSTIQGFGINCFAMLSELGDVYVFGQTPPVGGFEYNNYWYGEAESSMAFDGIYTIDEEKGATLHVPVGCREAWDIYPWNMWFRTITDDAVDGIEGVDGDNGLDRLNGLNEAWFDLSGRKLAEKPVKAGIYINGGKKIVIK